jgi:hypothetical protein
MSVMRPKGSICHEWDANRRPRCGSVRRTVNAVSYLWRVNPGSGAGSTRVVPF